MSTLRLTDVSLFTKQGLAILNQPFSLTVEPGQWVRLFGHNGSGKSTLLKAIAGTHTNTSGMIAPSLDSTSLAYLPQQHELKFDWPLSLRDVAGLFKAPTQTPLLLELNLDRLWNDASGGEKQRLLLALTLTKKDTKLLLLDEPFNHLDQRYRQILIESLVAYRTNNPQISAIVVDHQNLLPTQFYSLERGLE